jgi:hypothetical protein
MRQIILVTIATLLVGTLTTAPIAQAVDTQTTNDVQNEKATAKRFMKMINKPVSSMQLFNNIKFAIANDLFLQAGLYTEDNLKKLFGVNKVKFSKNLPKDKFIAVYDWTNVLGGGKKSGAHIHFNTYKYVYNPSSKKSETIDTSKLKVSFSFGNPSGVKIPIEIAEKVFGKNSDRMITDVEQSVGDLYEPKPLLPKPTHKLGNKIITYTFDNPLSKSTISLKVRYNGNILGITFRQEEK